MIVTLAKHRSPGSRPATADCARRAFSLVELLIVVAVMSVLAAMTLARAEASPAERLQAAARVLVADLDYARSLAVRNNSFYRVTFQRANRRYVLEHAGANSALHALPSSPFRHPTDPPTKQTTRLDEMAGVMGGVELAAMQRGGASLADGASVSFGPLGQTVTVDPTVVWLAAGSGGERRFISVTIQPVTGLAGAGPIVSSLP